MAKKGFIKVFRSIEEWTWFKTPGMLEFWIRLLIKAEWEDCGTSERGTFLTSISDLAKETSLTEKQVRTNLARLIRTGEVKTESVRTPAGSMARIGTTIRTKITICKYDSYQSKPQEVGQEVGRELWQEPGRAKYKEEKEDIKNINNNTLSAPALAHVHAQAESPHPPAPFPNPFILSSVERSWCMGEPAKMVECKRRHLAENLSRIAGEFGMDGSEQTKFLDYYCSPSVRNPSEIRAEADEYFNLRQKVEGWMKRMKSDEKKPASRIEQYADTMTKFNAIMDSIYGPDNAGTANGPGYYPDEQ